MTMTEQEETSLHPSENSRSMDNEQKSPSPEEIRKHRMELGLTYIQLGKLVNVHWSTVRKWEFGHSLPPASSKFRLLEKFVNGDFDNFFKEETSSPKPKIIDAPWPEKLLSSSVRFGTSAQKKRNHILSDANFLTELEYLNQFYLKKFFSLKDGGYF